MVSSKLSLEGPIIKDKTSFAVSGRLGYYNLYGEYLKREITGEKDISNYHFYDINAKLTHKFSNKSKIYISFYNGLDVGEEINTYTSSNPGPPVTTTTTWNIDGQNWYNIIGTIGWVFLFLY